MTSRVQVRQLTIWLVGLVLFTPSVVAAGAATPVQERIYNDPQGRFLVPVPTNWTAKNRDGVAVLSSPEGNITAYLLVLPGQNPEAVIARAWRQVDPDFTLEPTQVQTPPPEPGVARTVVTDYEVGERVYQGSGQLVGDDVYVFLLAADLAAIQRRGAQVNIVASGFEIASLEETDLTGAEPLPVTREMTATLETFVNRALKQFGVPGAAVAVVQNGKVIYTGGFGVREAGGDVPLTPDTHMMIGSVGKSLTTMLMATLVDEGRMTWDTPVREILPEFAVADPALSKTITVRNLVCACTGVPRRDFELLFNADDLTAEGVVESLRSFEFFTDFGEAFQYSNQLVGAGGYAAAAADGAPYGDLFNGYDRSLTARVLKPIGMTHTTVSFEEVARVGNAATPHTFTLTGTYAPMPLAHERLLMPIVPAGAHWSTAEDMAKYLLTELALGVAPDGTRVVSEENLRTTWEPQVSVSATTDYGLGWFVEDYKGLRLINHGGNTLGFTSDLTFLPDAGLGVVVLANGWGTNSFNMAVRERLLELVFDQEPRVAAQVDFAVEQTRVASAEVEEKLRDTRPAAVRPFVGRYRNDALGEVALSLIGGVLMLDAGEFTGELRPVVNDAGKPDGYILYDGPLARTPFTLRRGGGRSSLVMGEGAEAYTFEWVGGR